MESHEEKKEKTNGDLGFPFQFFQNFKFPHLEFPQLKKVEVGEVGDGVASKANESDVGVGGGDGDGDGKFRAWLGFRFLMVRRRSIRR
ncbi:hypothetical protein Syun_016426 [Stephania yunnanensis]|uniref:Uncharacterized protein n=1 Tax=Stephania yunnanensis TaxID=152371 RepID=A0AAP0P2F5_9MAGN